jgi:tetratricopeptide (TPR) repeat protein
MQRISLAKWYVLSSFCLLIFPVISFSQSQGEKRQEIKSHFERAQLALRANKPDVAVTEFRDVLTLDPNNVEARANLGVIAFVQGDYVKAGEEFRQALKLQPSLWKAQALLGMCEKRLGKFGSAQTLLEKSFPHLQDPKLRTQAGMDLVELDCQSGDTARTIEVLHALEQLSPTDVDVQYAAYRIFSGLAEHAQDKIALINPDSVRMRQIMAQHLVNEGDLPGAIAQYRKALGLDPSLSGAHFELGEAILQNSKSKPDIEQSQKEFEAALALNPYDSKSECWLGKIYVLKQDLKIALEHYSRALALNPNDVDAHIGVAKVLAAAGQPEGALGHLLEAIQLDPLNVVAHYRLSAVYRQLGRTSDASRELVTFKEVQERKKRIIASYQQMHESPASSQVMDPDIPQ